MRNCYKVGLQGADWYLTLGEALPSLREEAARFERLAGAADDRFAAVARAAG